MPIQAGRKLGALLLFLILISLSPTWIYLAPLAVILAVLQPARANVIRALWVLPFSGVLAITTWLSGNGLAATMLLAKSYLSILAVLAFNAITPAPEWIAALRSWRVPTALVEVLQFLHRYLWVVSGEAHRMRTAAAARGGFRFDSAAGALGVLFARSWARGERVHRAMVARGYEGQSL